MTDVLSADFFAGNRERLRIKLNLAAHELALMPAHVKLQKTHDEAYQFVQDSNFFYLTGIREPDCLVVIGPDFELLLSPPINPHHQLWEGQASVERLQQISGITEVKTGRDSLQTLRLLTAGAKKVYAPLPYDSRILHTYYRMIANPARKNLLRQIRRFNNAVEITDLRSSLAELRMIKQPIELEMISRAVDITVESIKAVQDNLATLRTERDAQALLEYEFLRRGADGTGFDTMIASGANTTQIHYMFNNETLLDKTLLLLDVGAQVNGYKADISRVISQEGFTPRQQQIYDAVQALQAYAFSLLKPGASLREYEDVVDQKTEELTRDLQVSRHKTVRRKLRVTPHMVSHHLGLDAHDAANYDAPLEPGMVLAVEPGIYLLDEGIGMRIEDDVVITEKGCKVLSSGLQ